MNTIVLNDLFNEDGFECSIAQQRKNRAVKNAHKLYLFSIFFGDSDITSIRIDRAALDKLKAGCNTRELEMFKLLISGYNQIEVAQKLNISQSTVSRKVTKFKKILSERK